MQKIDAVKTVPGTTVTFMRKGVKYEATVLRAPTFKDGDLYPTKFKVNVADGDYAGNHYVSYSAVHTAEADKSQAQRAEAEALAKSERKALAELKSAEKSMAKKPKAKLSAKDAKVLRAVELLHECGYEVQFQ